MALHVIPADAAAQHEASAECWCRPLREEGRRYRPAPLLWHGVTYTHRDLVSPDAARRAIEALS